MANSKIKDTIILAAAEGKSMYPVTKVASKYLMNVVGKTVLDYWVEHFKQANVDNIVLSLYHFAEQIKDHFKVKGDDSLTMVVETQYNGTGSCLLNCVNHIKNEAFYVTIGDRLILNGVNPIMGTMDSIWDEDKMDCLMLMVPTIAAYGINKEDQDGEYNLLPNGIVKKKKERNITPYLFADLAIMKKSFIENFAQKDYFSWRTILCNSIEKGRAYGVVHDGEWFRLNTLERHRIANDYMFTSYAGKIYRS